MISVGAGLHSLHNQPPLATGPSCLMRTSLVFLDFYYFSTGTGTQA